MNDIKADLYDESVVYAVFDNHKYGDYKPYLFKSSNKGKTWNDISNNLPDRTLLWRIVQDHKKRDLLFLGTEFGVYCSLDGAKTWEKLEGGFPNISVRDLAIQKRENDLVAGTFGRGIYILDDYSALREIDRDKEAQLFQPRDGQWYLQRKVLGWTKKASQGDNFFVANNPPYGVEFTYFLKENFQSKEALRQKAEKKMEKDKGTIAVPDWSVLEEEKKEIAPVEYLFIYDEAGNILRRIAGKNQKGFNRISWDLTTASTATISIESIKKEMERKKKKDEDDEGEKGSMVGPGKYNAKLHKKVDGKYIAIGEEVSFELKQANKSALEGSSAQEVAAHWKEVSEMFVQTDDLEREIKDTGELLQIMLTAYDQAKRSDEALLSDLLKVRNQFLDIEQQFGGSKARKEVGENEEYPSMKDYLWSASGTYNTYGPTKSHLEYLGYAKKLSDEMTTELDNIQESLAALEKRLQGIGAPRIKK